MHHLCALDDVVPGEGLRVATVSPPVAVFRTDDDEVFVLDDTCSHQDASLADGWVEDCRVECPLHASRFDLRTGEVDQPPAKRGVRVHRAEVRDGEVWVELSTAAPNLPPGVTAGVTTATGVSA
ncbi:bifunctional 3-phenylpropionate/cinnamic acid dioxygenase ferredoxin subunit [Nocardioides lentus]|uniref:Bifunctional 3-phenylpropionate/cinnamic acid dioxygenase ferredoxin subunit n=1 Tax=Nocardioides lentus TaxID=338077 RepID=A0ABN2PAN7_9ACTN